MTTEKTAVETESSLQDFEWENEASFFGTEAPPKPEEKPATEEAQTKEAEEEAAFVEAQKASMFADPEEDTEAPPEKLITEKKEPVEEPEKKKKPVEQADELEDVDVTDLALDLRDRNIISFEDLEEGETITASKLYELKEQEIQTGIDEFTDSFVEALKVDQDGAAFIRHKKAGGSTREFFETFRRTSTLPVDADITTLEGQKQVAEYVIRNIEKADDEDTEGRLQYLEDNGKLKSFAEKKQPQLKQMKEQMEQDLLTRSKRQEEEAAKLREQTQSGLREALKTIDNVNGIDITQGDENILFMTEPTVKTAKGYIPAMHAKIAEILTGADKKKLFLFSELLKNDFDLSAVKKAVKKKHVKETRIAVGERPRKGHSSVSGPNKGAALADNF